ncbi:hypothetical protein LOK49_LG09G02145 [Camellia lanceoleosa]|uniref:Uncharacterized protein n=1 Tax=Camellia lanceoleosa TaxID=1840588 RepID=A0ACC0GH80_9ERIC|nr:hypothetical protein LOK49_LG09G02145 [Camellia lanceoleosa]
MHSDQIVSWIKSEGDVLSIGEFVVVVESDKADMDVETFYDGILTAIVVGEGEVAPIGAPIGLLAESQDEIAEAKAKAATSSSYSAPSAAPPPLPHHSFASVAPRKIVVTPFAKKLAKQHKIDINSVVRAFAQIRSHSHAPLRPPSPTTFIFSD